MNNPIGVFDSGIGGITVLKELIKELPNENFIYFADSKNAPYGPRSKEEIISFSEEIINFLIAKSCKLVVIACNTATAAAVYEMRQKFNIPIVGLEPAVKPACLKTKTKNIAVLATEGTFRGNHFKTTSEKYQEYVTIHLQVAKGLVELAENGVFSGLELEVIIKKFVGPLLEKNIDQLVLGCTHYPFFTESIKAFVGNSIELVDSSEAVTRRTKDILMTDKIVNKNIIPGKVQFFTTGNVEILHNIVVKYLNYEADTFLVEIIGQK